jgi:hypothetical protein
MGLSPSKSRFQTAEALSRGLSQFCVRRTPGQLHAPAEQSRPRRRSHFCVCRKASVRLAALRQAPYLPSRPAFASASGIRYFASNCPNPPRSDSLSL